jgi:hypothetical protein
VIQVFPPSDWSNIKEFAASLTLQCRSLTLSAKPVLERVPDFFNQQIVHEISIRGPKMEQLYNYAHMKKFDLMFKKQFDIC